MEIMTEEYARWGETSGFYSLFSERQVARMEGEYEEADAIHVLSTYSKNSFVEHGIDERKLTLTSFGVDTEQFHPADEPRDRRKFKILYVGRLEILKGIQYLLEAFSEIRSKEVELHLRRPCNAGDQAYFKKICG